MVIRVANLGQHQIRVKAVVRETGRGFRRGAGGGSAAPGESVCRRPALFILAPRHHECLVSFLIMIEGNLVLTLDHVQITKAVLSGSDAARIVCLSVKIERGLEIAECLIGMTLPEQCAPPSESCGRIILLSIDGKCVGTCRGKLRGCETQRAGEHKKQIRISQFHHVLDFVRD